MSGESQYRSFADDELHGLLAEYERDNGPCGIFTRKIHEISAELHRRGADVTIAFDDEWRVVTKINGVAQILYIDWSYALDAQRLVR